MWKFTYTEVFKRRVSFVGPSVPPKHSPWCLLSNLWGLDNLTVFAASPHTNWKRRGCHKTHPKLFSISTFTGPFTPCAGTLGFLLDEVFLIRSLLLSSAKGSLLNIFFKLCIASVWTKHNNNINDYKILTGCGGKKRDDEFNGWPRINSANYASAWTCSRSNMLTIIIFSISATVVELNGKLFWIPL